jgi:hypothetical protein
MRYLTRMMKTEDRLEDLRVYGQRLQAQSLPISKLLYLFEEQIASKLGCKPILPEGMLHAMSCMRPLQLGVKKKGEDWNLFVHAWMELTKLVRSVSDVMFSSPTVTRHLLETGGYVRVVEHFKPLLSNWKDRVLSVAGKLPLLISHASVPYVHRVRTCSLSL